MRMPMSQLEEMFQNMRGRSGWDTNGELLWGYFFTDPDQEKLKPVAEFLDQLGYRVVKIYKTDDGTTNFLHVEKVERHTPQSLYKKNADFDDLAARYGLESYDGWDVGKL